MTALSKTPTINYVSESVFGFRGNGVHTAYLNTLGLMRNGKEFSVKSNSWGAYEILHAHTFGPIYWVLRWLHRGKRVIHAHAIPETLIGQMRLSQLWLPWFTRYLVAYFNSADLVLCMTRQLETRLRDMGVRSPITVMPLSMDLTKFKPDQVLREQGRKLLGFSPEERVVLGVGQIIPKKGVSEFLEVAKANPDIKFVWAGKIPFSFASDSYSKMKALLQTRLPNVIFPGVFELEQMPLIYNAADVFLFPSFHETFGLAVAEAAACGLPLLLRDLGTYHESFADGFLGVEKTEDFSNKLRALFASQPLRSEYAKRAESCVRSYNADLVAEKLTSMYHEILEETPHVKRIR